VIELYRKDDEFSINVNGRLLMSSRMHGSEEALAEVAITALGERAGMRVLVGGLGCGYTLRAALNKLGDDASVVVAELVPAVVKWNREVLGELADWPLNDARVSVSEGDVLEHLGSVGAAAYDVILLDVDNGPIAFTQDSNAWLYSPPGLEQIRRVLAPGGVVAVWSAATDAVFSANLQTAGFAVVEHHVRARSHRGGFHHVVWVATPVEAADHALPQARATNDGAPERGARKRRPSTKRARRAEGRGGPR
jgi:spermidine synthase